MCQNESGKLGESLKEGGRSTHSGWRETEEMVEFQMLCATDLLCSCSPWGCIFCVLWVFLFCFVFSLSNGVVNHEPMIHGVGWTQMTIQQWLTQVKQAVLGIQNSWRWSIWSVVEKLWSFHYFSPFLFSKSEDVFAMEGRAFACYVRFTELSVAVPEDANWSTNESNPWPQTLQSQQLGEKTS